MRNAAMGIFCLILAFVSFSTKGVCNTPVPILYQTFELDQLPSFQEGAMDLSTYLQQELAYPLLAREEAIEGKVFIEFIIAPNGAIQHPTVVKGIGYGCDEEVLRVFNTMANWTPGVKKNRPVATRIVIPVTFELE